MTRYILAEDMAMTIRPGIMIPASLILSVVATLSFLMMKAGMVNSARSQRREITLFVT